MQPDDDLAKQRVGQTIGGKWKLEHWLGEGGMAAVYAATSPDGERAAIKLLHPEMARRKDVRERFLQEAYVANRVGHPGAVRVLSHGSDTDDTFLVMELLEGEPLSARAQRLSDFTVRELLGYADEILDTLAAAHDKSVIHRDIKPDNIFITNDRHAKILDFGIARVLDDVPRAFKTRTGLALGTVPYMAPEQALGRRGEVDGRSDIFALGALLFRILSGRRIHDEKSEAELLVAMATRPASPLGTVAPNVPAPVCSIVDLALAFSRDARYPDARTMQGDIRAVLAGHRPPYALGSASHREASTRMEKAIPAVAAMGLDSPTGGTMVSQGHTGPASSLSAPTRVVVPQHAGGTVPDSPQGFGGPTAPGTHNVTAPMASRVEKPPPSIRPDSRAIAMPMIDDLDALIMSPLPAVPSAYGATVPAATPPPPFDSATFDSAPPPAFAMAPASVAVPPASPLPVAPGYMGTAPAPEKKKKSSALGWILVLAFFVVGTLIAFGIYVVVNTVGSDAIAGISEASEPPAATTSASATPAAPASESSPPVEPSAAEEPDVAPMVTSGANPPALTTKAAAVATAATAPSKAITPPTRPAQSSAPAQPPATTTAKAPPPPPTTTPPPTPPKDNKDKKDKKHGH